MWQQRCGLSLSVLQRLVVVAVAVVCRRSYRALYDYAPCNDDEMRLQDGDVVEVMERCDDGWFVGLNRRTNQFGTFPGNYVDKLWSVTVAWGL